MKKQASLLIALVASFAVGQAVADNYGSQRDYRDSMQYTPNNKYSQKVNQSQSQNQNQEDFARTVDMNYEPPRTQERHPIFQERMGGH